MGDVMQQGRRANGRLLLGGHRAASTAQAGDDAMGQGADTDGVIKAGMQRPGIDQVRRAQLLDATQALHDGQVEQGRLDRTEFDVAVNGVAEQHGVRGLVSGFSGLRVNPYSVAARNRAL